MNVRTDGRLCPPPRTSTEQTGWSRWLLETPSWAMPDSLCQSCLHDPHFVHVATLPAPLTRPGHPALKVSLHPDSWCSSDGPAASRQNPGWNKTPAQSSPFLPSTSLTRHLLCQALEMLQGPRRHGLCLLGETAFNSSNKHITAKSHSFDKGQHHVVPGGFLAART